MAIRFVLCRRVDDHSVTSEIAETALPHQTLWEPIPTEEPATPGADEVEGVPPHPEPTESPEKPEPPTTSRRSRSRAATDSKE